MASDTGDFTQPLHAKSDTPTPNSDMGVQQWSGTVLTWSAAQAARETGAARSTILEAIKSGRLNAAKDENGAWQITPESLGAAGFNAGKPTPPDPTPEPGKQDGVDALTRLRLELAEVRADSRVAVVERDAERRLREAAERERDVYRRMIEAPKEPSFTATQITPETIPEPAPHISPASTAVAPPEISSPQSGRFRRAWNVLIAKYD